MKKMIFAQLIFVLISVLTGAQALAWGGRGHHAICEAAVFLVKNPELKQFLQSRPQVMGHLCNIPDTFWREASKAETAEGNPSHFLDSEYWPGDLKDMPLDYRQIVASLNGKKHPDGKEFKNIPHELGSVLWRADQFYRLAVANRADLAQATPDFKMDREAQQDDNNPYNKAVYGFYVNLGLMGHFVGDCSQPFHITSDYDGWDKGHGGVHSYYEDQMVDNFDGDLTWKVIQEGRQMLKSVRPQSFLSHPTVLENMRALAVISHSEIDKALKADTLIKMSEHKGDDKKSRVYAERAEASANWKKFDKMIVTQMARAATLLAHSWESAYADVGSPNLKAYKNFKYPFEPAFVYPDYYDIPAPTAAPATEEKK